jgi:hypothetical protein
MSILSNIHTKEHRSPPRASSPRSEEPAVEAPQQQPSWSDDEDRDTLVSNSLWGSDLPPLIIELSVEVPPPDREVDPAARVLEPLCESLRAHGFRATVISARRAGQGLEQDIRHR